MQQIQPLSHSANIVEQAPRAGLQTWGFLWTSSFVVASENASVLHVVSSDCRDDQAVSIAKPHYFEIIMLRLRTFI